MKTLGSHGFTVREDYRNLVSSVPAVPMDASEVPGF